MLLQVFNNKITEAASLLVFNMTTNYIALIRRADFTDLFKYGNIHINTNMTKRVSGDIRELSNSPAFFEELFYFANAFDYSFSYLFIHYKKTESGSTNNIRIEDVLGIYPLDNDAKREFSLSFDPRIKIQDPLCPNAVVNFQKEQAIKNSSKGVENIWKIYNISEEEKIIDYIDFPAVIKEVIDELYEDKRPSGDIDVWVYILRYDRHAFFPNNTIGAFMDTVNVIFNYINRKEVDSYEEFENTSIMKFLNSCNTENYNMKFEEILNKMYSSTEINKFINYVREIAPQYDLIKAATLFFLYKNQYQEGFKYDENWKKLGLSNGKEFFIAFQMLGLVLGHKHTYDCLYSNLPLAIFNDKELGATKKEYNNTVQPKSGIANVSDNATPKKTKKKKTKANNNDGQIGLF